jgi:RNA polymerase sigma-B factor
VHDLDTIGHGAGSGSPRSESPRSGRAVRTGALFAALVAAPEGERDALRQEIVLLNADVARRVAGRYYRRGLDRDDLDQTAYLALVVAVRTFDPELGHDFMSFAVPTILGGVRRHFRDHGWTIRVPRRVQEVQVMLHRDGLPSADEATYGTETVARLAQRLGRSHEEVEDALRARGCFRPASLDDVAARGGEGPDEWLASGTAEQDAVELRAMLGPLVDRLPPRDRTLLRLRFGEDRTQQAIARELQLTQAQVSRLLARVIARLRAELEYGAAQPSGVVVSWRPPA